MFRRITAIVAVAAALTTGAASAQDWQGFYVGAHAGYAEGETDFPWGWTGFPVTSSQGELDLSGEIYGVQAGYNWQVGGNWVIGVEGQATWGDREDDDGGLGGDVNELEINAEYSARLRAGYLIRPSTLLYATGGWVMMDADATAPGETVGEQFEGWTYGVGAEHRFTPNWSGFIEYRHDDLDTERFTFPVRGYDEDAAPEFDSLRIGVNYRFGRAAPAPTPVAETPPPVTPPPPPVAPVCPTSDFVVYFEWDRSNLNQAALETIDAAVTRARECNISGVLVVGHTDTSGSPTYNQGLSERRASVVRDALVARGIGAGSITTQARGETDLARATRDGVREPLNRRTAVTISFR